MARRKYRGKMSLLFMLKAEVKKVFSFEEQRNNSTTQSKLFKDKSYIAATFLVQNLQIMVFLITPCCLREKNILLFNFYLISWLSFLLFFKAQLILINQIKIVYLFFDDTNGI